MKINNPLSVLNALQLSLRNLSAAVNNLCSHYEALDVDTKCIEPISKLALYNYRLTTICLKLSDPTCKNAKLTAEEEKFISELYFPASQDIDEEDEAEEMKDDITGEEK